MTARRMPLLAALTMLACVLPIGMAHAAGAGQITSPAAGAVVTQGTDLVVEVTGDTSPPSLFEPPPPHQVEIRLANLAGSEMLPGTSPVAMSCSEACNSTSTWTAPALDPATLAPFANRPSCNGGYTIQVRVDGGSWTGHGIRIARAPSAPTDVSATAGVEEATVAWGAAGDPDVVGYRVQRRPAGGSWTTLATRPADARSLTDTDVAPGEVQYRVATLKGDGVVNGAPAAPCADTQPDLSTSSAAVGTTVESSDDPSPSSSPSPSSPRRPTPTSSTEPGDGTTDGSGDGEGDGSGDGTSDGDGTAEDTDTAGGGADAEGGDGDTAAATRRPGTRVAPPTAVDAGSRPRADVAEVPGADRPQVADERETFYGEDEEFSEELDFDGLGGVEASGPTVTTETRIVRVPGALQSVLGEELDVARVVTPFAAGLIMVAFALHLRRWVRAGVES